MSCHFMHVTVSWIFLLNTVDYFYNLYGDISMPFLPLWKTANTKAQRNAMNYLHFLCWFCPGNGESLPARGRNRGDFDRVGIIMCWHFVPWLVWLHRPLSVHAATDCTAAVPVRQVSESRSVLDWDKSSSADVHILWIHRYLYRTGQLGGMTVNAIIAVVIWAWTVHDKAVLPLHVA